ncbi:MAG: hypothetical protein ABSD29_00820 [Verrucomicrobiota bacterium]|jgi:hypothetical protein
MRQTFVRKLIGGCILAALLGLTGCVTPVQRGDETRWQPQLLYLNRSPCPSLYVEVAAVAGTEPSEAVLEQLRQFLAKYCDKPGGIRIVRDNLIPRTEARGFSHDALACRYLQGPPANGTNSSPAFIYILYYDSALCQRPEAGQRGPIHKHLSLQYDFGWVNTIQPHAHLLPFPGAIFIDRRFLIKYCPRSLEGLLLMHEAGHVLGLVQNETHGFNNHCTNRLCLMRPKLMIDLPRALFSRQKTLQTNLCEMCQADLRKGRTAAAPTNLIFLGPVLVRSEAGYFVATLPGQLVLFSGELAKFDVERFLKQSREDADHPEIWRGHHARTYFGAGLQEPLADWARQIAGIEQATTDRLELVRQAGTNCVPALQCVLGQVYFHGERIPKDENEAAKWFRKSAESGYAKAQDRLAWCFADGKGVPQDDREAFNWFRKAAEQGFADAQNQLGVGYAEGFGVGKDPKKALQWFRKAAEAGDVGGQRNLGHVLAQGQGTSVDVVQAYQWLSVAAGKGDKAAKEELAGLTKKLSQGQLKRGREKAAAFSRQSASEPALVE